MSDVRLILDTPASGAWNMAVDEALWESCERTGVCCWRFYQWEEATLSLGYFQTYAERSQHAASRNCPIVRRASGGGAIVHDVELTYSLAVPLGHPLAARPQTLYEAIHTTLIETLFKWGVSASLRGKAEPEGAAKQPFLCFQRCASGDVVVGTTKIGGSAQRRSRGAVLQHGSILVARSAAAPELDGLRELASAPPGVGELATVWCDTLRERLGWVWGKASLTDEERERAAELVVSKYGAARWTQRR